MIRPYAAICLPAPSPPSSRMWKDRRSSCPSWGAEGYEEALAEHRRVIREACAAQIIVALIMRAHGPMTVCGAFAAADARTRTADPFIMRGLGRSRPFSFFLETRRFGHPRSLRISATLGRSGGPRVAPLTGRLDTLLAQ
jgi:hypothetical protein